MAEESREPEETTDEKIERAELRTEWAEERTEWAEERTKWAEDRTEQAEERTEWAEHRTLLANERNFSAWLRTGMSAMAGGLAIVEFLTDNGGTFTRIIGILLIAFGVLVCGMAIWRYNKVSDVLEGAGLPTTPKWIAFSLVAGLMASAVLILIVILVR